MAHLYAGKPVTYVAAEELWDGVAVRKAGTQFEFEGRPGGPMLPTCEEGKKRLAEAANWDKTERLKVVPTNEVKDHDADEKRAAAEKLAKKIMKENAAEADLA